MEMHWFVCLRRVVEQLKDLEGNDLEKYVVLQQLYANNETLYFKVLGDHLVDLLPIVYTPTVGLACEKFDRIYQRPVGMYFSYQNKGEMRQILENCPTSEVDIVVVTDGGRILGLGDLGTNGMGISIGKVSLYVAGAGFNPRRSLPVCLDVGTDR